MNRAAMDEIENALEHLKYGLFGYHPEYEYTIDMFKNELRSLIELVENEQAEICGDNYCCYNIYHSPRVSETIDWKEL